MLALVACTREIKERCRFINEHVQPSSLPPGFAEVDRLLIRRVTAMTQASRELRSPLVLSFRIWFAEESLPILCTRLERARELALAGRVREAGVKYQSLLLALQVYDLTVAMHAFSQYAGDRVPIWQVTRMQDLFVLQTGPLLDAALSEDPVKMERALAEHGGEYGAWVESLGRWSSQVSAQEPRLKVAETVWNVMMLVIATRQAAVAAADLVAAGRPPMPPLPAFAVAGGAGAVALSSAAALELAEALRRLVVLGAMDAGVAVGLSQMGTVRPGAIPPELDLPTSLQISDAASALSANTAGDSGQLRSVGPRTWQSRGGLVYGPGGAEGDRLLHVLEHASDIPGRPGAHGVFSMKHGDVFALIDEAYGLARTGRPGTSFVQQGSRAIYTVDMGRPVGFIGGRAGAAMGNPATSHVRIVLEGSNVITAYPVLP